MNTPKHTILIVGAGISGLALARELAKGGKQVIILEALDRPGGRIHTVSDPSFVLPIELGAEFIHGKLPHTFDLIKDYKLDYSSVKGDFFTGRNGTLKKNSDIIIDADEFEKKLKIQEEDENVNSFLEKNFPGENYNALKNSVRKFVEGYDAADANRASVLNLKKEWLKESWKQYRIKGGYKKLVDALIKDLNELKVKIEFSQPVKEIHWGTNMVNIKTSTGEIFSGQKSVITVPLGVLMAGEESHIQFYPPLVEKFSNLKHLGFGPVIKIVLQFKEAFWRKTKEHQNIGFIFSDEIIPTWWTQLPDPAPILTGWLGGPPALFFRNNTKEEILENALQSVANIFQMEFQEIKSFLYAHEIINWGEQKFSHGAYRYATVNDRPYLEKLAEPVHDTLFFAGEGFHTGDNSGTVEAAIANAFKVAEDILKKN